MLNSNIINKFNSLSAKEKRLSYIIPMILFINLIYIFNIYFVDDISQSQHSLKSRLSNIVVEPKKATIIQTSISDIENMANEMIVITSIINNENNIKIDAKSSYKDMLRFVLKLQNSNIFIEELQIKNENNQLSFMLVLDAGAS